VLRSLILHYFRYFIYETAAVMHKAGSSFHCYTRSDSTEWLDTITKYRLCPALLI